MKILYLAHREGGGQATVHTWCSQHDAHVYTVYTQTEHMQQYITT